MSEKILNEILMESYRKEFEEFDIVPPHKPSFRHRIAMKKILKKVEAENKPMKRISPRLALAIILLAVLAICVAAVKVLRVSDYSGVTTPQHSLLTFMGDTENCPQTLEHIYVLQNIPEGFEYVDGGGEIGGSTATAIYWNSETNNTITFSQAVKNDYANSEFNTEKYDLVETTVNGCPGFESVSKENGYNSFHMVWDDGEYIFDIAFSYNISKTDAENIVKSAE